MPDRLRAVLFDLDDTLIDWSGWGGDYNARNREHVEAVLDSLPHDGWREPDLDDLEREYTLRTESAWASGRSTLQAPHLGDILVESLAAVGVPQVLLERDALARAVPWTMYPGLRGFEDAVPTLRLLQERGIRRGLVTNAHQPMALRDRELQACGLLEYLPDCRISAADVGWLKPHPRIFRAALERLGVEARETVFVGDNPVADVAGAQNVGMRGVLRAGRDERSMLGGLIEPDARVGSLAELPPLLDAWFPGWR